MFCLGKFIIAALFLLGSMLLVGQLSAGVASPLLRSSLEIDDSSTGSNPTTTARSGDTLKKIARRLNVPVTELVRLNKLKANVRLAAGTKILLPAAPTQPGNAETTAEVVGNDITLADGYSFRADEVWKEGDEVWYRKGNISQRLEGKVRSVKPITKAPVADTAVKPASASTEPKSNPLPAVQTWIYMVNGSRFRVDEVQETNDGAWYSRNNLSVFLERERIARIEREQPDLPRGGGQNSRDWTSGNPVIDQLIRINGARFGIDPYLVFLVIEQESSFRTRAISPKGARGLMQLMPATARRFGVKRPFDPAENIGGGTRYLKELLTMFDGRVDLALASYNAGEGAVTRYGRTVPPYKETRDYVKRIGKRYGISEVKKPDGGRGGDSRDLP